MNWFKSFIVNQAFLRKLLFPLLRKINFKVKVKHDLTGRRFFLNFGIIRAIGFTVLIGKRTKFLLFQNRLTKGIVFLKSALTLDMWPNILKKL